MLRCHLYFRSAGNLARIKLDFCYIFTSGIKHSSSSQSGVSFLLCYKKQCWVSWPKTKDLHCNLQLCFFCVNCRSGVVYLRVNCRSGAVFQTTKMKTNPLNTSRTSGHIGHLESANVLTATAIETIWDSWQHSARGAGASSPAWTSLCHLKWLCVNPCSSDWSSAQSRHRLIAKRNCKTKRWNWFKTPAGQF